MEWEWFPVVEGLDWASLVGPAVVAAVVSGIVTTIGFLVNRSTTLATHRERLRADQRLAERKVEADIALAERKVRLDRELADWKRRMELAEQVLADFYKARDIILAARAPFAFAGEGESRPRLPNETEEEARHRDAIYAPFERLSREREFLSELHARRFRFMALFGNEAATPFMPFIKTYNQIGNATRALINDRRDLGDELRTKFETLIGWTSEDEDPVKEELDQAVADMEALCRPVLETRPV